MFRFSIEHDAPIATGAGQLAEAGITRDEDFRERLRDTDEFAADERYYRAENRTPDDLDQAVAFVQGVIAHVPQRVWLDGEVHSVSLDDAQRTRTPGG